MTKKRVSEPKIDPNENRFAVIFIDNVTHVQVAAATGDMDKFTKTDLMKMVKAFKEGVREEEKFDFKRREDAEKELKDEKPGTGTTPRRNENRTNRIRRRRNS